MTTKPSLVDKVSYIPGTSNHDAIPVFTINTRAKKNKRKPFKIYLYKKANIEGLQSDIREISNDFINDRDLTSNSTEALWSKFKEHVQTAVNNNVPTKMVSGNKSPPWINQSLKDTTSRNNMLLTPWKGILLLRTLRDSKTSEGKLRRRPEEGKGITSVIQPWNLPNNFTATSKPWRMTLVVFKHWKMVIIWFLTTKERPNCLTHHLCVFINETSDDVPCPPPLDCDIPSIPDIETCEEGVQKLLEDLDPNKTTDPDNISPWVLRTTAEVIAPALTVIFKSSLLSGILPKD